MRHENVRLNDKNPMINCAVTYSITYRMKKKSIRMTKTLSLAANSSFDGKRAMITKNQSAPFWPRG